MKKTIIALAAVLALSTLAGCSEKAENTSDKTTEAKTDEVNTFAGIDTDEILTVVPYTIDEIVPAKLNDDGELEIIFDSNQTTGFAWSCNNSNEDSLKLLRNTYLQDDTTGETSGTGGKEHFFFQPGADGVVSLTFTYSKNWSQTGYRQIVYKTYSVSGGGVYVLDDDTIDSFSGDVTACADNILTVNADGIEMAFTVDNVTVPVGESVTVVYEYDAEADKNIAKEISSNEEMPE